MDKLLKIDPEYQLTVMDHTTEMLDIAHHRIGDRTTLFQADIFSLSIPDRFDIAISNGGLCCFVDADGECE